MRRRRFRPIPVRMLVPNVITLLAICAGLTAIRLSTEGRMELAVAAIVFAAVLDGIDGRVARMIKGQSKFGAELDSLADFVNFGVAPGLILYFWQLHELHNGGWIAAMVFAISGGLRLARFNATMDDPNKPAFAANYFTGVPAPAGAITVLLPIYLAFLGLPKPPAVLTALYTLLIAFLMVSRLPVFSGKTVRMRVPPEMVLPVFVSVIFFIALLIGYPWYILSAGSVLYLSACRPDGNPIATMQRKAAAPSGNAGRCRAGKSGAAVRAGGVRTGPGRSAGPAELSGLLGCTGQLTLAPQISAMSDRRVGFDPDLGYMADQHGLQNGRPLKFWRKRRDGFRKSAAACFASRSAGALRHADDLQRDGNRRAGSPADRLHDQAAGVSVSRSAADGRLCAHRDDPLGAAVRPCRPPNSRSGGSPITNMSAPAPVRAST